MRRATIASVNSRARSSNSAASRNQRPFGEASVVADDPQKHGTCDDEANAPPPMEPSMKCMSVVTDGPNIAFACYNEEQNEIILESCRASGYDTEGIVERFLQTTTPNLVLVGNKILNNTELLQLVTKPPVQVPMIEEEQKEGETNRRDSNHPIQESSQEEAMPSTASIPYRVMKSGSFDVRSCKALILQKLRVLSLLQGRQAQEHTPGYGDPYRNDRQFPLAAPAPSGGVFRPSSYHSLAALVDFDSKVQVQAFGSLLSFLQTSVFRLEEAGVITVNRIVHAKSSQQ